MNWLDRYKANDGDMTRRQEVLFGLLVGLLLFVLPLSIVLFIDTPFEVVILVVAIALFVVMVLVHHEGVKEDKAKGYCKGRNRVWSVYVSGVLLGLVGVYLIRTRWEAISLTKPSHWVWLLFGIFWIYRGVICIRAGTELSRTTERLEEYETELRQLRHAVDVLDRPGETTSEEDD